MRGGKGLPDVFVLNIAVEKIELCYNHSRGDGIL
jgi:hypothetical protein